MKKTMRKWMGLLLACVMICLPVSQALAETVYDVPAAGSTQVLFPGDILQGISGSITVNGGEATASEDGSWTNTDETKAYTATAAEDGTIQITEAGYILVVEGGVSKKNEGEDSLNHYQFLDWELEAQETAKDIAFYTLGETVKLIADEPEEGMEFAGWKCETEGVSLADPSSKETTLTMVDKKVTVTAQYQPAQQELETEAPQTEGGPGEIQTEALQPAAGGDGIVIDSSESGAEEPGASPQSTAYTVTVNNGSGTASYTFTPGTWVTVTADDCSSEGRAFTGWYVDSMNAALDNASASTAGFTMPEGDVTVTATYTVTYTVTVENGMGAGSFAAGTPVQVAANDRSAEGFVFAGWYVESGNVTLTDTMAAETGFTMPEGDVKLAATYEEIQTDPATEAITEPAVQELTTEPVTEAATEPAVQELTTEPVTEVTTEPATQVPEAATEPTTETVPEPSPQELTTEAGTEAIEVETNAAEPQSETDATEAQPQKYEVVVENGIGSGAYAAGETVTVEAAAEEGLEFQAWNASTSDVVLDDPGQEVASFVMPAEGVTVTAQYAETPAYAITVTDGTATDGTAAITQAKSGDIVTVTATDKTAANLVFDHWEGTAATGTAVSALIFENAASASTKFTMQAGPATVTAVYKSAVQTYQITVSNGLINGTATQTTVEDGTQVTLTANPSPTGYAFSKWVANDGQYDLGDAAYNSTLQLTVSENMTIRAEYEGIQYAVTVENGISDYEACVSGTTVTIEADEPEAGYEFDYWSVDTGNASLADAYSDTTTFVMPAGDVTVTANYKRIAFYVDVENGSCDQDFYYAGDTVTVSSNYPASGREFSQWTAVSGNASFKAASRWRTTFTMPASDVTVRATYKDGPSADDNLIVDIVAGGEYYTGDTIKFTGSGAGMANTDPNPGDYRYRPSGYQIGNVTGTWQASPYTTSMSIKAAGEYTLKVTFNKDVYDGTNWVSDGTTDTKSVSFRVITRAAGVATGDETPVAMVVGIAAAALVIFLILLVMFLKKRKK